jgi:hypothetical protein
MHNILVFNVEDLSKDSCRIGALVIDMQKKLRPLCGQFREELTPNNVKEVLKKFEQTLNPFSDAGLIVAGFHVTESLWSLAVMYEDEIPSIPIQLDYGLDIWSVALTNFGSKFFNDSTIDNLALLAGRSINPRLRGDAFYDAYELAQCLRKVL